jgi:hypothetical protein
MLAALCLMTAYVNALVWIWTAFVLFDLPVLRWIAQAACAVSVAIPAFLMASVVLRRVNVSRSEGTSASWLAWPSGWLTAYRYTFLLLVVASVGSLLGDVGTNISRALAAQWNSAPDAFLVLLVQRAVHLSNGVSPVAPVLFLAGALGLWGFQHFRTRGVPSHTILARNISDFEQIRCAGAADGSSTASRSTVNADALRKIRLVVFFAVLGLQIAFCFPYYRIGTVESVPYTAFFFLMTTLLQGLIAISIAQFLFVWTKARQALDAIAQARAFGGTLADAFSRLPASMRGLGVFTRVPKVEELAPAVRMASVIATFSLETVGFPHGYDPWFDQASVVPGADRRTLELLRTFEEERGTDPSRVYSDSKTWTGLISLAERARRRAARMEQLLQGQITPGLRDWLTRVDDLTSLLVVYISREISGRLIASILLSTVLTLMVLGAHTWYPAQPRAILLAFSWACITASVAGSITVFVQMDRDEVLSYVAGTRPNHLEWNWALVSKLALAVAVPLVTLFAAQFPELGGVILDWVQPMQKVLP